MTDLGGCDDAFMHLASVATRQESQLAAEEPEVEQRLDDRDAVSAVRACRCADGGEVVKDPIADLIQSISSPPAY